MKKRERERERVKHSKSLDTSKRSHDVFPKMVHYYFTFDKLTQLSKAVKALKRKRTVVLTVVVHTYALLALTAFAN